MAAGHAHGRTESEKNSRRLAITLSLVAAYLVAEVIGGLFANSLALLADAGHMLSDIMALVLSLFALKIARRPPTATRTYGYQRAEILAALLNGAVLVVIAVFILIEAYQRFAQPHPVEGGLVVWIAFGGLLINLAGLWILHGGTEENLNIRGAWLHVLGDTFGSVGTIIAGALIWGFGWYVADPAISVVISLLVIYSAWQLLAEATAVLMEGTPGHIDADAVRDTILGMPGVQEVHSLHIWSITSGIEALSGHIVVVENCARYPLLRHLHDVLHERFGIDHVTIQIEP